MVYSRGTTVTFFSHAPETQPPRGIGGTRGGKGETGGQDCYTPMSSKKLLLFQVHFKLVFQLVIFELQYLQFLS